MIFSLRLLKFWVKAVFCILSRPSFNMVHPPLAFSTNRSSNLGQEVRRTLPLVWLVLPQFWLSRRSHWKKKRNKEPSYVISQCVLQWDSNEQFEKVSKEFYTTRELRDQCFTSNSSCSNFPSLFLRKVIFSFSSFLTRYITIYCFISRTVNILCAFE